MQGCHREIKAIAAFTLLQLLVLCAFGYTPYPDSEGYIYLAKECIEAGKAYPVDLHHIPFIWNIGAINAVYVSLKLFGSIAPLLVLYSLLKGITAWLLFRVCLELCSRRTADIFLLLYLLYPSNYGEGTSVNSELPFVFFIVLGLWLVVCWRRWFAGAAMMGVANWFRPMGLVFLLATFVYAIIKEKRRKAAALAFCGYLGMIVLIGGTTYLSKGHFTYQAKTGWMALLQYSTDEAGSGGELNTVPETMDADTRNEVWRSRCLHWIAAHPAEYLRQMPKKLVNTYATDNTLMCAFLTGKASRPYLYSELSMNTLLHDFPRLSPVQWFTVYNLLYYYALLLLALVAVLTPSRRRTKLFLLSPILFGTALLLLAGHGESRFHIPFMPFIFMLAAMGAEQIKRSLPERKTR